MSVPIFVLSRLLLSRLRLLYGAPSLDYWTAEFFAMTLSPINGDGKTDPHSSCIPSDEADMNRVL